MGQLDYKGDSQIEGKETTNFGRIQCLESPIAYCCGGLREMRRSNVYNQSAAASNGTLEEAENGRVSADSDAALYEYMRPPNATEDDVDVGLLR